MTQPLRVCREATEVCKRAPMSDEIRDASRKIGNSRAVEWGARLGYAASGLMHLLIGWLALQIAWGGGSGNADQSGALATVARTTGGGILLWVVAVGFTLLAVWQVTEAVRPSAETGDRLKAGGKFVGYAALAFTSLQFALGGGSSSKSQSRDFTRTLMEHTGGRFLVGLVGLGVIGIGAYHVYKGWKKKFLEDLQEHPGQWVVPVARFGYIAKGVALGVVGGLFLVAAFQHQAKEASGLDGALHTLRDAPLGQWLLSLVALGILAYGVYSFARARYARV